MQEQIIQHAQHEGTTLAPDPMHKFTRYLITILVVAVILLIILSIGVFFLPEPLPTELGLYRKLPFYPYINFLPPVLPAIFIWPFMNMPMTSYKQWKWRILEKKRQQAVGNLSQEKPASVYPLPEFSGSLPETVSVRVCRSWRATLTWGAIYAPLIGFFILVFILDWQATLHDLGTRREISGWAFLGDILLALCFSPLLCPAILTFILAPRQRLVATRDGLICYRGLRFSFIPWHEARLFAVIEKQRGAQVYELASGTNIIRWSSKPTWNFADTFPAVTFGTASLGLIQAENSSEEYQWQILQLTAMVAAKTGLPLYDLR